MEILIFLCVVVVYLFPSVLAQHRKHANLTPIVLVNIFFGWTIGGWFIALIWATTSNTKVVK